MIIKATRLQAWAPAGGVARVGRPPLKQDAREAMRVVFSVLTKRICMHKTKFLMNIFKYCLKIILNSMNLQIATQLIIMFNF